MKIKNKQAIEAQVALGHIISMNLPVRTSLDIAILSNLIDEQVECFRKVRETLMNAYKIKIEPGEKTDVVNFKSLMEGDDDESTRKKREEALLEFNTKFNQLLDENTKDIEFGGLDLPEGLEIRPEILKPIVGFVRVNNGSD